jgi:hypothetical protein
MIRAQSDLFSIDPRIDATDPGMEGIHPRMAAICPAGKPPQSRDGGLHPALIAAKNPQAPRQQTAAPHWGALRRVRSVLIGNHSPPFWHRSGIIFFFTRRDGFIIIATSTQLMPSQAANMPSGIIRLDAGWKLDANHRFDQPPVLPGMPKPGAARSTPKRPTAMDYIPTKRAPRRLWLQNLSDQLVTEGPKAGMTAGEATALKTIVDAHIAKMDATDAAQAALDGARETEAQSTAIADIRTAVRRLKTNSAYTGSGVEGTLQLRGPESGFEPGTFKPTSKVSISGGQIRIDFTKGEADGVVVYCRLRGSPGWNKLGIDTASPYFDTNPPATPGVPETREYMVRAILDDVEIGQPSDIISLVFGG